MSSEPSTSPSLEDLAAAVVEPGSASHIKRQIQNRLLETAPQALTEIVDLFRHANNESVRLAAAKDVMDRAGFKPIERSVSVSIPPPPVLTAEFVALIRDTLTEDDAPPPMIEVSKGEKA